MALFQLREVLFSPRILALCFSVYLIVGVLYRIFFHPLRKIPGPWYAAATYWYEFYQDVILNGNYIKEYPDLHAKYGPVVRVSPSRVHVSDPDYFKEAYGSGTKYIKDPDFFQSAGGIKHSIIMLIDPEVHKERKNTVQSLFSTKHVEHLAPVVLDVVQRAMAKAQRALKNDQPINLQPFYQCITVDTIMPVLFDRQLNFVDSDEDEPPFLSLLGKFVDKFFLTKHFPMISHIAMSLPLSVARTVLPSYVAFREQCATWIKEDEEKQRNGKRIADGRKTYFDLLLEAEKTKRLHKLGQEALVDEALSVCFGGTDTNSIALSFGTYFLLRNPNKLQKMLDELKDAPTNMDGLYEYHTVSKLPYLTAVIKEILRLGSPVPGIIPRRVPAGGASVGGHYLPEGTTVSQALRLINVNSDVYSEPERFIPERWLGKAGWDLEKYFVPFSKGPRACIGVNIAYLELYVCFANLFGRFEMELFETNESTLKWVDNGVTRLLKPMKVKIKSIRGVSQ
ncbi:cytochrome P450 [Colletotrichum lupini]|nr:cytochrome P450 [Colletotrichum lupini]